MPRINILILTTALLSSCFSNNREDNIEIINFDFKRPQEQFEFGSLVDTVYQPIVLETTENSIIGKISKIAFHNDTIVIVDGQTNSIFLFDNDGRFLSKIKRVGRSRQEYLEISDVFIADDYILIYDKYQFKVCCYDFNGRYLYSFDTQDGVRIMENQKRIFVCTNWMGGGCWNNHFIAEFTSDGKMVKTHIKKNSKDNNRISIGYDYFIKTVNGFDFLLLSKNIVYTLIGDELYPRYKVDFGEKGLPEAIARKGTDYVVDNHFHDKYTSGVKKIIEVGRYRFIWASYDGPYTLVYDMQTKKNIAMLFFGGRLDGYPFAVEACFEDGDYLSFYQPAHLVCMISDKSWYNWGKDSPNGLVGKMHKISKKLNEQDNGVLIRMKLKNYDTD